MTVTIGTADIAFPLASSQAARSRRSRTQVENRRTDDRILKYQWPARRVLVEDAGVTPINSTDTGSGLDSELIAVAVPSSDTGLGVDSETLAVAVPSTDTGSGAETESVTVPVSSTDVGAGSDSETVSVSVPTTDTGTGVEANSSTAALSLTDTGSGADSESITNTASVSSSDSGAGVETESIVVSQNESIYDLDVGYSVEAEAARGIHMLELALGADTEAVYPVVETFPDTDIGTATELQFVQKVRAGSRLSTVLGGPLQVSDERGVLA